MISFSHYNLLKDNLLHNILELTDSKCCTQKPRLASYATDTYNGHMYICVLSDVMDGLKCKEDCYCSAPICLLYVNGIPD